MSLPEYDLLFRHLQRLDVLSSSMGVLTWDEQTYMPSGAADLRARQLALLAEIRHREATAPTVGEWLAHLESPEADLDDDQRVVVREARRDYDWATKLPPEFVAEVAQANSEAYLIWVEARAKSDFSALAPALKRNIELARRQTRYLGFASPYDGLIDSFDPGMTQAAIEPLFAELRSALPPLIARMSSPATKVVEFRGFAREKQRQFLEEVLTAIGYDRTHGRIDESVHPFCGGHPQDVRLTTRFAEDNPLDSLTSSLHEVGHALYEQGLRSEYVGTGLGQPVGMAVHESQSRLWENQVGRGRPFWQHWEGRYRELFGEQLAGVTSEELYRSINQVGVTPIRVDADEVTYNLHIILRYEIEKALFNGDLQVDDLPATWNRLSEEILGFRPRNDAEGCLQDVHWATGAFGYFPSYTLGNLLAAQLWETARREMPDLEAQLGRGSYGALLEWLRAKVHRQGRRHRTRELARVITGQDLSVSALLRYLEGRYLPLYTRT